MANAFENTGEGAGGGGGGGGDIMQLILSLLGGGQTSPLLKTILEPLLAIQQRGFGDQSRNLTDQFRAAGALKGGSYGVAVPKLLGDQGLAKSALIGNTSASMLGPLLQALMTGRGQDMTAANANNTTNPWASVPPSQGLQTPMSGDTTKAAAPVGKTPNQTLNLDELLQQMLGTQGGTPQPNYGAGLGAQGSSSGFYQDPNTGSYSNPPIDPWAGVMGEQDWSNFYGE